VSWCTENVTASGSSLPLGDVGIGFQNVQGPTASVVVDDLVRAEAELSQSQEQLRALAARLHEVREEESIRIARELHDQLGRCLTTMKMDLSLSSKRNPQRSQPAS
jgi:signal transduction histidine kinase